MCERSYQEVKTWIEEGVEFHVEQHGSDEHAGDDYDCIRFDEDGRLIDWSLTLMEVVRLEKELGMELLQPNNS